MPRLDRIDVDINRKFSDIKPCFLKVRYFPVFHAMDRTFNSGYRGDGSNLADGDEPDKDVAAFAFYNVGIPNNEIAGSQFNHQNSTKKDKLRHDIQAIFTGPTSERASIQALFICEYGHMNDRIWDLKQDALEAKRVFVELLVQINLNYLVVYAMPPYIAIVDPNYWKVVDCTSHLMSDTQNSAMKMILQRQGSGAIVGVANGHVPSRFKLNRRRECLKDLCQQFAKDNVSCWVIGGDFNLSVGMGMASCVSYLEPEKTSLSKSERNMESARKADFAICRGLALIKTVSWVGWDQEYHATDAHNMVPVIGTLDCTQLVDRSSDCEMQHSTPHSAALVSESPGRVAKLVQHFSSRPAEVPLPVSPPLSVSKPAPVLEGIPAGYITSGIPPSGTLEAATAPPPETAPTLPEVMMTPPRQTATTRSEVMMASSSQTAPTPMTTPSVPCKSQNGGTSNSHAGIPPSGILEAATAPPPQTAPTRPEVMMTPPPQTAPTQPEVMMTPPPQTAPTKSAVMMASSSQTTPTPMTTLSVPCKSPNLEPFNAYVEIAARLNRFHMLPLPKSPSLQKAASDALPPQQAHGALQNSKYQKVPEMPGGCCLQVPGQAPPESSTVYAVPQASAKGNSNGPHRADDRLLGRVAIPIQNDSAAPQKTMAEAYDYYLKALRGKDPNESDLDAAFESLMDHLVERADNNTSASELLDSIYSRYSTANGCGVKEPHQIRRMFDDMIRLRERFIEKRSLTRAQDWDGAWTQEQWQDWLRLSTFDDKEMHDIVDEWKDEFRNNDFEKKDLYDAVMNEEIRLRDASGKLLSFRESKKKANNLRKGAWQTKMYKLYGTGSKHLCMALLRYPLRDIDKLIAEWRDYMKSPKVKAERERGKKIEDRDAFEKAEEILLKLQVDRLRREKRYCKWLHNEIYVGNIEMEHLSRVNKELYERFLNGRLDERIDAAIGKHGYGTLSTGKKLGALAPNLGMSVQPHKVDTWEKQYSDDTRGNNWGNSARPHKIDTWEKQCSDDTRDNNWGNSAPLHKVDTWGKQYSDDTRGNNWGNSTRYSDKARGNSTRYSDDTRGDSWVNYSGKARGNYRPPPDSGNAWDNFAPYSVGTKGNSWVNYSGKAWDNYNPLPDSGNAWGNYSADTGDNSWVNYSGKARGIYNPLHDSGNAWGNSALYSADTRDNSWVNYSGKAWGDCRDLSWDGRTW